MCADCSDDPLICEGTSNISDLLQIHTEENEYRFGRRLKVSHSEIISSNFSHTTPAKHSSTRLPWMQRLSASGNKTFSFDCAVISKPKYELSLESKYSDMRVDQIKQRWRTQQISNQVKAQNQPHLLQKVINFSSIWRGWPFLISKKPDAKLGR